MHPNIRKLHAHIELVAALCAMGGLVAMQLNDPSLYTQYGIYCWTSAQCILIGWWDKRLSSAAACLLMGVLNMAGAAWFLTGCYITDNHLGIFISCCYFTSSFMQFVSGIVKTEQRKATRLRALALKLLARKILIAVAALQAVAAMCFLILLPAAGFFYTIAAFMNLMINILVLQLDMQGAPAPSRALQE